MRALKILVVVLGVLLVGGTVALVVAMVQRIEERRAVAPPPLRAATPTPIVLDPGARVLAATLSGNRLLVRLARAGGGEELVLFDAASGAEIAIIDVPRSAGQGVAPQAGSSAHVP